ncbi:MAG: EutN/CcmL family microcompartment protein [Christensenella sp.]|uniref:EutN/CcmL family microcompartment protein n=1 Tax=Christensenella sp. TaxID=1935934 RepID=UPI002B206E4E|nr:EutN/CcmL family microcompartment protein [Christensenella sp.]MEA5003732.1 EutN/CcmL family microcompartment protein [Christensenella sp.]
MYTGEVAGCVIATAKDENLENIPLLVVRLIENGEKKGCIVAADATRQAGRGDFVYLIGSKEAARMFRKQYTPVDAAIVGFIDRYMENM